MSNRVILRQRRSRTLPLVGAGVLALAVVLGVVGILARQHDESALVKSTDEAAIDTVAVIRPQVGKVPEKLVLPGDVEAWYVAPIYGQVSGYIKMWYKDIGAVVKQGDLLAVIDTPDLDAHVEQAKALLAKARADEELADITARRWQHLLLSDSVSRQETDVQTDHLKAAQAATLAAQHELDRLNALEGFKSLIAPFDGVVTARRTDVGALVRANGVSNEPEMFEVADIHMMRVYVRVPQAYSSQIHVGMKAQLRLPQFPGRPFEATVNTTSRAINLDSRTLLVELWAPNPTEELMPGTYADVDFELPPRPNAVKIPTSALIFQDHGLQVAVVDKDHRAHLRQVTIGRDMGADVIVISGITGDDAVIDSPPDALNDGDEVRVVGTHGAFPGLENTHQQLSEASR